MSVTKTYYGNTEGKDVYLFTLTNSAGMSVKAINLGCHIMQMNVPDKNGRFADVVLSFDSLKAAETQSSNFGVVVGRFANRIEKGTFELNGKTYHLYINDGNNHLHGGKIGFSKKVWDAEILKGKNAVLFSYLSPDGEESYPGNLEAEVTYSLSDDNCFMIEYKAQSDKDTVINLTNHSYFNLAGHDSGTILDHYLKLNCDKYTPANNELIPTGEIEDVEGTPLDFREYRRIGDGIDSDHEQIRFAGGYDHNFVINKGKDGLTLAASLWEKKSSRMMDILTDKPGIQFYSGNFLHGADVGKGGCVYQKRAGLCLETQFFPNGINIRHFPSPILKAGETYKYTTVFRFSIK